MGKMTQHYFAYGSNLNLAYMRQQCLKPKVLGIARLPHYRVEFYGYTAIWDGAQETVVPDRQTEVWGVLYELTFSDCEQLDAHVDARFDGTGPYFHYPVDVIGSDQQRVDAIIYKKDKCGEAAIPSSEYLQLIVQGAKEQGLPSEYIALLEGKMTKSASYAVPVIRRSKFSWTSATCGDCGQ